ncbi:MAG: hypothetical protein RSE47_02895 [Acidaminococcaceae bacterium]
MRKIVAVIVLMVVLGISNLCMAASNSSILGNEEKTINRFLGAVTGSIGYSEELQMSLAPGLQKKITATNLGRLKAQIQATFGDLVESKLFSLEKYDKGDKVTYVGSFSKEEVTMLTFAFILEDGKPLLSDFAITPVQIKK